LTELEKPINSYKTNGVLCVAAFLLLLIVLSRPKRILMKRLWRVSVSAFSYYFTKPKTGMVILFPGLLLQWRSV